MTTEDIKAKGLTEIETFLRELPDKVQRNLLAAGLREAAKPIAEQVKANLAPHHHTGQLAEMVKIRSRRRRGLPIASVAIAGMHKSPTERDIPAWLIAYWLEYTGAAPHLIRAKKARYLFFLNKARVEVEHPGFAAKPFLRPAAEARKQDALSAFALYMRQKLATKFGLDSVDVRVGDES